MKITGDYKDSCYRILNKGRVIAKYATFSEYRDAQERLDRMQMQVDRPEVFCACKASGVETMTPRYQIKKVWRGCFKQWVVSKGTSEVASFDYKSDAIDWILYQEKK